MKRRLAPALALAIAGLILSAVPAAAQTGLGEIGRDEWNFFLTNIYV